MIPWLKGKKSGKVEVDSTSSQSACQSVYWVYLDLMMMKIMVSEIQGVSTKTWFPLSWPHTLPRALIVEKIHSFGQNQPFSLVSERELLLNGNQAITSIIFFVVILLFQDFHGLGVLYIYISFIFYLFLASHDKSTFDVVLSGTMSEDAGFLHSDEILTEILKILKPNGAFYLNEPQGIKFPNNFANPKSLRLFELE